MNHIPGNQREMAASACDSIFNTKFISKAISRREELKMKLYIPYTFYPLRVGFLPSTALLLFLAISYSLLPSATGQTGILVPPAITIVSKISGNEVSSTLKQTICKRDACNKAGEPERNDCSNQGNLIKVHSHVRPLSRAGRAGLPDLDISLAFPFGNANKRFNNSIFRSRFFATGYSLKVIFPHHSFW